MIKEPKSFILFAFISLLVVSLEFFTEKKNNFSPYEFTKQDKTFAADIDCAKLPNAFKTDVCLLFFLPKLSEISMSSYNLGLL
jgi:hypothetical protein